MSYRVLVVDDHPVVRAGIVQLAAAGDTFTVAGEAGNVAEALAQLRTGHWDLVLLDVRLPGHTGLEALAELREAFPQVPVLMFTGHHDQFVAMRAFTLGAAGYLSKTSSLDEIAVAMSKVLAGGRYVSGAIAEYMVNALRGGNHSTPHDTLSNREYQIMTMLAGGKTVTQVARELGLSVKTVSAHRGRLLRKMGMNTSAELTYYCVKQGIV